VDRWLRRTTAACSDGAGGRRLSELRPDVCRNACHLPWRRRAAFGRSRFLVSVGTNCYGKARWPLRRRCRAPPALYHARGSSQSAIGGLCNPTWHRLRYSLHYRNRGLCREPDPLGTGLYALGTACAERELSAERSRHRWAGTGGSAESHGPNSRHSCAESPLSSRHRPVHN
jgi:hypothetical protein